MSCGLSPSITEIPAGIDNVNLSNNRMCNGTISKQIQNDSKSITKNKNGLNNSTPPPPPPPPLVNGIGNNNSNNNQMDDNNNSNSNNNCDMANNENENVNNHNGVQGHGEGSPLRSQLGLKLRANKPKITIPTVPSPLTCLLCPYTTKDASILEEHINRSHFDPISPGISSSSGAHGTTTNHVDTLEAFSCPICVRCFESCKDLEVHVNHEHTDILSPAKIDSAASASSTTASTITLTEDEAACNFCPVCGISFLNMKTQEMELHIDEHFAKSPTTVASSTAISPDLEKEARKVQEQREFEMLRAQYGMDDQGNFREQSAVAMQRAVYAGNYLI